MRYDDPLWSDGIAIELARREEVGCGATRCLLTVDYPIGVLGSSRETLGRFRCFPLVCGMCWPELPSSATADNFHSLSQGSHFPPLQHLVNASIAESEEVIDPPGIYYKSHATMDAIKKVGHPLHRPKHLPRHPLPTPLLTVVHPQRPHH